MATINLLPWRRELRDQQKKEFLLALSFSVLAGVLLMLVVHGFVEGRISYQQDRNRFLSVKIKDVDKKIAEITALDKQRAELKTRMELIQKLQHSRPQMVHLFDALPRVVPDGIHLTSLKKHAGQLEIRGRAESNTRISTFLRNMEVSPYFGRNPDLTDFSSDTKSAVPSIKFLIKVAVPNIDIKKEDK